MKSIKSTGLKKPALNVAQPVGVAVKSCIPTGRRGAPLNASARAFLCELGAAMRPYLTTVSDEVEANVRAWMRRHFINPHAGRVGNTDYERPGALDDCCADEYWYSSALDRAYGDYYDPPTNEELGFLFSHPLILFQLFVGITDIRGIRCLRRGLTCRINQMQQQLYRKKYYAKDNARRRQLAAERRKIRRRQTSNPCPTTEHFRAAFARVHESVEAKIYFGGLVHDLECYVDNCLRFNENGDIIGRNGGIKAWLAREVPELYGRYKTIMRYKSLAKRVRQVAAIHDPTPTDVLLSNPSEHRPKEPPSVENYYAMESHSIPAEAGDAAKSDENYYAVESHAVSRKVDAASKDVKNYYAVESHDPGLKDSGNAQSLRGTQDAQNPRDLYAPARRRMAKLLDGCANTMAAVWDRIEEALGETESTEENAPR